MNSLPRCVDSHELLARVSVQRIPFRRPCCRRECIHMPSICRHQLQSKRDGLLRVKSITKFETEIPSNEKSPSLVAFGRVNVRASCFRFLAEACLQFVLIQCITTCVLHRVGSSRPLPPPHRHKRHLAVSGECGGDVTLLHGVHYCEFLARRSASNFRRHRF
jgi:hypothetical protein